MNNTKKDGKMQNKTSQKTKYTIIIVILALLLLFFIPTKTQASQDVTNSFKDENLKNAIIEIIQNITGDTTIQKITLEDIETITSQDLPSGKQLNLAGKNIQDLSGLELFADRQIEWIYLDWNNISDISVLSNFTTLTKISASRQPDYRFILNTKSNYIGKYKF